ncbi:LOW QUALITY PROTEIN: hypothetical protein HID58_000906, partial [Brassica napus]
GSKRRLKWFLLHWILGTIVSIVGIINIYTGIRAYNKKTSSSSRDSSLWTILFTDQLYCLILFYLIQDKREHFQKQRVVLDNHQNNNTNGRRSDIQVVTRSDHEQKVWFLDLVAKVTHLYAVGSALVCYCKYIFSSYIAFEYENLVIFKDSALSVGTVKRDKVELKAIKEGAVSYASLEKKAQLYEKLVRGELSDEQGEEKYCVDFFRKGMVNKMRVRCLARAVGTADIISQHVRMVSTNRRKQSKSVVIDFTLLMKNLLMQRGSSRSESSREKKATELNQRRQDQATNRREKLKQAYLRKQLNNNRSNKIRDKNLIFPCLHLAKLSVVESFLRSQ